MSIASEPDPHAGSPVGVKADATPALRPEPRDEPTPLESDVQSPLAATGETHMANSAKCTVHVSNERVIVNEWRFAPGASTGWHRHEYDYVIVPIMDGKLRLLEPGGVTRDAQLQLGIPYFRKAGVEHDVVNPDDGEFAFIEIEIK
ncbi:MAG: cupin domain-containing protein [Rhodospirillales bacterium]